MPRLDFNAFPAASSETARHINRRIVLNLILNSRRIISASILCIIGPITNLPAARALNWPALRKTFPSPTFRYRGFS
jgi:hypothetical protein